MRHVPSTSGGGDSRPLVAVVLGVALLAAVFVVATGPAADPTGTDEPLAVTVTATPVDTVPAGATAHRHSNFEVASPVHRAVKRAGDTDASATTNATVSTRSVVRLSADANRTEYYVRRDAGTDRERTQYRVTVEKQP